MNIIKRVLQDELKNSLSLRDFYQKKLNKLSDYELAEAKRYDELLKEVNDQIIYLKRLLEIE